MEWLSIWQCNGMRQPRHCRCRCGGRSVRSIERSGLDVPEALLRDKRRKKNGTTTGWRNNNNIFLQNAWPNTITDTYSRGQTLWSISFAFMMVAFYGNDP